jgi:hypothetical protein
MKRFDVLILGDLRFPGGTSAAIAHELRALRSAGYSVGLYHVESAYLRKKTDWQKEIVAELHHGAAEVIPADGKAEGKVLFVHSPWVLPKMAPTQLSAPIRILVAHHPPVDARGRLYYDPWLVQRHARTAFGKNLIWAPISPVCRDAFDAAGLTFPRLRMDWTNLLFVDDWGAARSGLIGDVPIIGRHSRPRTVKWPNTREALLQIYPNGGDITVKLMGLSDGVKKMLHETPRNWQILETDEIPVAEFLKGLDFFVYFHHPDWLEAFGRTIAEAVAAGCVVIVPPYFRRTFGDACLYCEPGDALALVRAISADPHRFAELSSRGRCMIDERFGPNSYLARLEQLMRAADGRLSIDEIVEYPRRGFVKLLRSHANRVSFHQLAMTKARPKRSLKRRLKDFRRKGFRRTPEHGS